MTTTITESKELSPLDDLEQRIAKFSAASAESAQPVDDLEQRVAKFMPASPQSQGYGNRPDGTAKGNGYLGALPRTDNSKQVSSELSVGVNFDGKETLIPTMVPTLTPEEVKWILANDVGDGSPTAKAIIKKAADHAKQRLRAGKSPFAEPGESPAPQAGAAAGANAGQPAPQPGLDLSAFQTQFAPSEGSQTADQVLDKIRRGEPLPEQGPTEEDFRKILAKPVTPLEPEVQKHIDDEKKAWTQEQKDQQQRVKRQLEQLPDTPFALEIVSSLYNAGFSLAGITTMVPDVLLSVAAAGDDFFGRTEQAANTRAWQAEYQQKIQPFFSKWANASQQAAAIRKDELEYGPVARWVSDRGEGAMSSIFQMLALSGASKLAGGAGAAAAPTSIGAKGITAAVGKVLPKPVAAYIGKRLGMGLAQASAQKSMVIGFSLTETSQALVDASEMGLKGSARFAYAARAGAIEGGITSVFALAGIGGVESQLTMPARQGLRRGIWGFIKNFGVASLEEVPEEILTEMGHALNRKLSADPNANAADTITEFFASGDALNVAAETMITAGLSTSVQTLQERQERHEQATAKRIADVKQMYKELHALDQAGRDAEQSADTALGGMLEEVRGANAKTAKDRRQSDQEVQARDSRSIADKQARAQQLIDRQAVQAAKTLADKHGITQENAYLAAERARARKGNYAENLEREIADEVKVSDPGLEAWSKESPEAAARLAGIENPSRADFEKAGLPRRPASDRTRIADKLRALKPEGETAKPAPNPKLPSIADVDASSGLQPVKASGAPQSESAEVIELGKAHPESSAEIDNAYIKGGIEAARKLADQKQTEKTDAMAKARAQAEEAAKTENPAIESTVKPPADNSVPESEMPAGTTKLNYPSRGYDFDAWKKLREQGAPSEKRMAEHAGGNMTQPNWGTVEENPVITIDGWEFFRGYDEVGRPSILGARPAPAPKPEKIKGPKVETPAPVAPVVAQKPIAEKPATDTPKAEKVAETPAEASEPDENGHFKGQTGTLTISGTKVPVKLHGKITIDAPTERDRKATREVWEGIDLSSNRMIRINDEKNFTADAVTPEAKPAPAEKIKGPKPADAAGPTPDRVRRFNQGDHYAPVSVEFSSAADAHAYDIASRASKSVQGKQKWGEGEAAEYQKLADDYDLPAYMDAVRDAAKAARHATKERAITAPLLAEHKKPKKKGDKAADTAEDVEASGSPAKPVITAKTAGSFDIAIPRTKERLKGEWAVMELDDLITSDDEGYDSVLQPRNRDTKASQEQINHIAANLDPTQLAESPVSDSGAPTIDQYGQVVSGNGRTLALRLAHDRGTTHGYAEAAAAKAKALGLDASGLKKPVLVRVVRDTGNLTMAQVAEFSNKNNTLQRTDAEIAEADAKVILSKDLLLHYHPAESGDVRAASNMAFLNAFVEATGADDVRNSDGTYSPKVDLRVRRAVLAAILGDTPGSRAIVTKAIEQDGELGIKRQLDGLMLVGGDLLRLGRSKPQFDLSEHLSVAIDEFMKYKAAKADNKVKYPADWSRQINMFDGGMTTEQRLLFTALAEANSMKDVVEYFQTYLRIGKDVEPGGGLFGGDDAAAGPESVLDLLREVEKDIALEREIEEANAKAKEDRKNARKTRADVHDSGTSGNGQGHEADNSDSRASSSTDESAEKESKPDKDEEVKPAKKKAKPADDGLADNKVFKADSVADAKARLAAKRKQMRDLSGDEGGFFDSQSFIDYVIIGGGHAEALIRKVGKLVRNAWNKAMRSEDPDLTDTELDEIWNQVQKEHGEALREIEAEARAFQLRPEMKPGRDTARLAEWTEETAVEARLIDELGSLPLREYAAMDMKEQAEMVAALSRKDAIAIAMGKKDPPEGLRPASVYVAVAHQAVLDGDYDLVVDLATKSNIPEYLSALGQEIKAADARDPFDPIRAIRSIIDTSKQAAERRGAKTEAGKKALAELDKQLADVQKQLDDATAKLEQQAKELAEAKAAKQAEQRPVRAPRKRTAAKHVLATTETRDRVRAEMKAALSRLNDLTAVPGLVAKLAKTLVIEATWYLEEGGHKATEWAKEMLAEYGESIKPHLTKAWDSARVELARRDALGDIKEKRDGGADWSNLQGDVRDLYRVAIADGIGDELKGTAQIEARLTWVHEAIEADGTEATLEDVRDAMSGYGESTTPDQSPLEVQLRDEMAQHRELSKLRDMEAGQAPLATGPQRDKPSQQHRDLTKKVNEAKKAGGYANRGSRTLQSALDTKRTRLTNELADLDKQIEAKKRTVRSPRKVADTPDIKAMLQQRAEKKALLDILDPKKPPIQSLEAAMRHFERRMDRTRARLVGQQKEKSKRRPWQDHPDSPLKQQVAKLQRQADELTDRTRSLRGMVLTRGQTEALVDLAREAAQAKSRMEASERRKPDEGPTAAEMEYGMAATAMGEYVAGLKAAADKLTIDDLRKHPIAVPIKAIFRALGLSRALRAAWDASFPFRQGYKILLAGDIPDLLSIPYRAITGKNKGRQRFVWSRGVARMAKMIGQTFMGENVMRTLHAEIISDPDFDLMRRGKLAIATTEEAFPEQMPGADFLAAWATKPEGSVVARAGRQVAGSFFSTYKASQNAFEGAAYYMRFQMFRRMLAVARASGVDLDSTQELKSIARLVNSMTGRGKLGSEQPGVVNALLWAPKLIVSHIDVLTAYSLTDAVTVARGKTGETMSRFARVQAAYALAEVVGGIASIMAMACVADPDSIEWDPRSSDFGKIKIGSTRFDITGGMGSLVTLAFRILPALVGHGSTKSSTTGQIKPLNTSQYGAKNAMDVFYDFLENKTSPPAGLVVERLRGEVKFAPRIDGKPQKPEFVKELIELYRPLPTNAAQENWNNPDAAPWIAAMIAELVGISTSTYAASPPAVARFRADVSGFVNAVDELRNADKPVPREKADEYRRIIKADALMSTAEKAGKKDRAVEYADLAAAGKPIFETLTPADKNEVRHAYSEIADLEATGGKAAWKTKIDTAAKKLGQSPTTLIAKARAGVKTRLSIGFRDAIVAGNVKEARRYATDRLRFGFGPKGGKLPLVTMRDSIYKTIDGMDAPAAEKTKMKAAARAAIFDK